MPFQGQKVISSSITPWQLQSPISATGYTTTVPVVVDLNVHKSKPINYSDAKTDTDPRHEAEAVKQSPFFPPSFLELGRCSPDVPLPGNVLQLLLGDPKASPTLAACCILGLSHGLTPVGFSRRWTSNKFLKSRSKCIIGSEVLDCQINSLPSRWSHMHICNNPSEDVDEVGQGLVSRNKWKAIKGFLHFVIFMGGRLFKLMM